MAESGSGGAVKEVGEGLRAILERIADFFDIFDGSPLASATWEGTSGSSGVDPIRSFTGSSPSSIAISSTTFA
jgi:hypothetical protein